MKIRNHSQPEPTVTQKSKNAPNLTVDKSLKQQQSKQKKSANSFDSAKGYEH
jgi:hypothetical protein